ncbi:hypothetical protein ABZ023_32545 [Streptomyces sp. NPDC006367]|uniref:hypothetical protein n=1 Tax=unclassified Streptomyces TaxID=2593676 RepID=UPI0033A7C000
MKATVTAAAAVTAPAAPKRGADQPVYEVRPLKTPAARAEAAALAEERIHALAAQRIAPPYPQAPAAFRQDRNEAVGLYENDEDPALIGCLLLHRGLGHRVAGVPTPGLRVSLFHTAPHRDGRAGWRMTMWLRDYAARQQTSWVCAEAPGRHSGPTRRTDRLLGHLRDLGWEVTGSGLGPDGHRLTRLRLPAAASPGLSAMIRCSVPLRAAGSPAPKEAAQR